MGNAPADARGNLNHPSGDHGLQTGRCKALQPDQRARQYGDANDQANYLKYLVPGQNFKLEEQSVNKRRNQHVIMNMSVSLISWRGDRQTFGESWPVYAGQVFNQLNLQFRHLT